MRTTSILVLTVCWLCGCSVQKQEIPAILEAHKDKALFTKLTDGTAAFVPLFNGKDLSGWYTYTEEFGKNNDEPKEFQVEDGLLHLAGEEMGYICTNASYANYYLRVVFRWGEKKYAERINGPRDSGVLYHIPEGDADRLWPTSIECQIQENDCGDLWCVGGTNADSPNADEFAWNQKRIFRTANFEKPNPEWNTIEVICLDNTAEHYVNGHLVNHAYNLTVSEGKILLQLEGAEIYYKTVELLPLK